MNIVEALAQMDVLDDEQWTQEGSPKTEVVSDLVGSKVSRADITNAAPKFTRQNPVIDGMETEEKNDAVQQETQAEEVIDTSVLESYLQGEPMLPEIFVQKILRLIPLDQLETLENFLIQQQSALETQQKQLDEIKRRVKFNISYTRSYIKQTIPDMSNQEAIRAYINRSQEQRLEKAQAIKQVLGGLKPSDLAKLDPRAAIDKAFARKTARGGQRPTR